GWRGQPNWDGRGGRKARWPPRGGSEQPPFRSVSCLWFLRAWIPAWPRRGRGARRDRGERDHRYGYLGARHREVSAETGMTLEQIGLAVVHLEQLFRLLDQRVLAGLWPPAPLLPIV